ncbi:MAG: redox-regulated ATPase YchF [Euryarchaeota archaeon]|nr:redox-regulated ATPase YchF [Euryarchaeota archaeon]
MEIGVVGKPNVGKSTFFRASTLGRAEIAGYPFTTVEANRGVAFVRVPEPAAELGVEPNPRNSFTAGGYRFVPVEMIDVAGLVPRAHEGRGLGNRFLDDLRQAGALIHVVDASGGTDEEGNPLKPGEHDPREDVRFLEEEIELWFFGIFKRNWEKLARRVQLAGESFERLFQELFAGLGVREAHVKEALREAGLSPEKPAQWSDEELFAFTRSLRRRAKPIVVAANKVDIPAAEENVRRLRDEFTHARIIPTSAMAELMLRELAQAGAISYIPGEGSFEILSTGSLSARQKKALEIIKKKVLERYGSTGVQQAINVAVLEVLGKIVVFPVEDEHRYCDGEGNVLPDAFLLDRGATPRDLAYRIHTEIGENFIAAIDARTKRKIASDAPLKHLDIVKIVTRK